MASSGERAGDDGDRGGREPDREYDQARHRRPILPEVSGRGVVSRIEQVGSDEERQCKLGRDAERRRSWKKREERATERQEDRIGCPTRRAAAARVTTARKRPRSCSSSLMGSAGSLRLGYLSRPFRFSHSDAKSAIWILFRSENGKCVLP